ncbi:putative l-amino acid oxidase protein [Phaeoacremonium minimum UCRPA7]|uniref:Putative l-amino acid oxidase protein n=1 Tax=Phaeoacremonium minimum (strain UCR-PA7) TaxID=1286976 RepID=R8BB72_PHAM7|nr:putative l-amino acid oxidase protein [Phaeoacremonium minimum UCRPA7]EON96524.1 putative l-amino acid oxidase protein [Phaeoacremonium minimum UCRPA7]
MERTFRLFRFLGLEKSKIHGLLPYYLDDVNGVCPAYFNDIGTRGNAYAQGSPSDPYKLNKDLPPKQQIPADMSVRQFLSSTDNGKLPRGPGYNFNTIEWIECATYGSGWFDQSLAEWVLEELDFKTSTKTNDWWCVDGGAQKIARLMAQKIKIPTRIQMSSQVLGINANTSRRTHPDKYVPITISITQNNVTTEKDYFTVFNSTTLGALERMNLQNAGLQ